MHSRRRSINAHREVPMGVPRSQSTTARYNSRSTATLMIAASNLGISPPTTQMSVECTSDDASASEAGPALEFPTTGCEINTAESYADTDPIGVPAVTEALLTSREDAVDDDVYAEASHGIHIACEAETEDDRPTPPKKTVRWSPILSQTLPVFFFCPETGELLEGRAARDQAKREVLGSSWQRTYDIVYRDFRGRVNSPEEFARLESVVAELDDPCLFYVGLQWGRVGGRNPRSEEVDEVTCAAEKGTSHKVESISGGDDYTSTEEASQFSNTVHEDDSTTHRQQCLSSLQDDVAIARLEDIPPAPCELFTSHDGKVYYGNPASGPLLSLNEYLCRQRDERQLLTGLLGTQSQSRSVADGPSTGAIARSKSQLVPHTATASIPRNRVRERRPSCGPSECLGLS